MNVPLIIRLPIIPGINDRKEHFSKVSQIVSSLNYCKQVEIMPYHILGEYKYELLGRSYVCEGIKQPSRQTIDEWKKYPCLTTAEL